MRAAQRGVGALAHRPLVAIPVVIAIAAITHKSEIRCGKRTK